MVEHEIIQLSPSLSINWIIENSSNLSTLCAGYNEDIFLSPEDVHENIIVHIDSNGQYIGNHNTKQINTNDISNGSIMNMHKQNCGLLIGNNENFYARLDKQIEYCKDSSNTDTWWHYQSLPTTTLKTHISRAVTLNQQTISNGTVLNFSNTFTPYQVFKQDICSEQYSCESALAVSGIDKSMISVSPNPANRDFTIKLPEDISNTNYEIIMYNTLGQLVYKQKKITQLKSVRVNTESLQDGLYFLHLKSERINMGKKIMVKH